MQSRLPHVSLFLLLLRASSDRPSPFGKGSQRCRWDGLWYNCGHPSCTHTRICTSNPGLLHCACPGTAQATNYGHLADAIRCKADGLWYACSSSGVCSGQRACASNPKLEGCACPQFAPSCDAWLAAQEGADASTDGAASHPAAPGAAQSSLGPLLAAACSRADESIAGPEGDAALIRGVVSALPLTATDGR